jgi:hypothetical protein
VREHDAAKSVIDGVILIESVEASAQFHSVKQYSTYRQASWLIGSSLHPKALNAFVGLLWQWTALMTSGRALCTATWIAKPAGFTACMFPGSTTMPSSFTRHKSAGFMWLKLLAKGLILKAKVSIFGHSCLGVLTRSGREE